MNHWPFILAAYAVVIAGVGGFSLTSWLAMRNAERAADALRDRK
ncbi:MAG TPA: hypothetical protein VLG14_05305 [Sphingomonas sp.]|nr:hypothetical protein [Sphingomonas sp.]